MLRPGARWWYIDDGQLVVHPTKVDYVLRALDRRLGEAGASRGSKALGHKVKSSVKAYIPDGEEEACRGWCTDYIVDTCEVISSAEAASKVLGVEPDSKLSQQFEEVMAKVVRLHAIIEEIRDAGGADGPQDTVRGCQQGDAHLKSLWGSAWQ